jgi:integrase
VTADTQLQFAEVELVDISVDDVQLIATDSPTGVGEVRLPATIVDRYLAAEADRIAARASTAGTRRQYGSIYRSFATWLAAQLGSAAAGRRPRRRCDRGLRSESGRRGWTSWRAGGAGNRPRVRVDDPRARVTARSQRPGSRRPRAAPRAWPPETLTDVDYTNLLRVPDRRSREGKRDYALLSVLGDCGLRSAELRRLRAEDVGRPRANARYYRLYVHGKGGREREVSVPDVVKGAIDAWVRVQAAQWCPSARSSRFSHGLRDRAGAEFRSSFGHLRTGAGSADSDLRLRLLLVGLRLCALRSLVSASGVR